MKIFKIIFFCTTIVSTQALEIENVVIEQIQKEIIKDFKIDKKEVLIWKEKITEKISKRVEKKTKPVEKKQNSSSSDWMQSKINAQDIWAKNRKLEAESWIKEKQAILSRWGKEKEKYRKKINIYKKSLTPIPLTEEKIKDFKEIKSNLVSQKIELPIFPNTQFIQGAFQSPPKDQGKRPTCASFAGIRALEILANRKNKKDKLSEQYFYWASKPYCQNKPCNKRGSWIVKALQKSQLSKAPDIPTDRNCPYNKTDLSKNQTQLPLPPKCFQGYIKVKNFSKIHDLEDVRKAVNSQIPVVGAIKLNENFYHNNGHIFQKDSKTSTHSLDEHAEGHAILFIGTMELPEEFWNTEGKYCFLVSNSWGEGWGKGGHSCLSQKWLEKYQYPKSYFVAIEEVI